MFLGNGLGVCYEHMEWRGDAMCIYFAHMKNDQLGDRPRDPRHIYANPIIPEVCPILSLGIYWAIHGFDNEHHKLFPGSNQYERYRKGLGRSLSLPNVVEELQRNGIQPRDIGSHSSRKGASTFVSSGSTACPPAAAVNLRAGWLMGGVTDTYVRYEAAGDMYVGRTVSGLPMNKAEFALLPPYFHDGDENMDIVSNAITLMYPQLPPNLYQVAEYCLASLVYHAQFIMTWMPANHAIFETAIFRDSTLMSALKEFVICELPSTKSKIQATGVPPHVMLLQDMGRMLDGLEGQKEALKESVTGVIEGIVQELEDRAIGAGTVTRHGLEDMLMSCLTAAGVGQSSSSSHMENLVAQEATRTNQCNLFFWNGQMARLPQDFKFPTGGPCIAWQYWCCGNEIRQYPPLRFIKAQDIFDIKVRKRLADYRLLMGTIENKARALGIMKGNMTIEESISVYEQCKEDIAIDTETAGRHRKRRLNQLTWITYSNELRKRRHL